MLRVEVVDNDKLILTQIDDDGKVTLVPKNSVMTYEDVRGIERKGLFACIFWPQPEDKMGKAPYVVMRRASDEAIIIRLLPKILNVQTV